jgi:hypothetical protein
MSEDKKAVLPSNSNFVISYFHKALHFFTRASVK